MAISSIEEIPTPRGLTRFQVENVDTPEDINTALNSVYDFAKDVANYMEEQYEILHNGALIRSWQVEELLASTIGAGTITVDNIYLHDDKFELDGALGQIRVKDDGGIVMLEFGEFASGTDWGIKVRNASNDVIFQALSNAGVTFDGSVITNATISGAALINGTITGAKIDGATITGANIVGATITGSLIDSQTIAGSNIANNTITDTQVGSLSASTINAGTLTVDGSPAISVTGSGAMVFQSGGDIIMKHSGSGDDSLVQLKTSSDVLKGELGYNSTNDITYLRSANTADLYVISDGKVVLNPASAIELGASSSDDIDFVGRVISDVLPDTDNSYDLGNASFRWALVRGQTVTSGDLRFENDYILTEPNMLDPDADPHSGLCIMNHRWEQIGLVDEYGNLEIAGTIKENVVFKKPLLKRTKLNS